MKSKTKYIMLIVGIISLGLLLTGGTYAYLTFTASVTNGKYNSTSECFLVDYTAGNAITGTLFQSKTPKGGLSGSVTMNINSDCNVPGKASIILNVGSSTSSILLSEGALKYAIYTNVNSSPVSSGTITSTGNIALNDANADAYQLSQTAKTYYIYVWLDGTEANNNYVDLFFSGYIHASATQT